MNTRRIAMSLAMIVFAGALVAGATGAFFSDEETSTGNVLAAGAIDLQIDNSSYYNGEASAETSWSLSDLTDELFFNFTDLKPGDWGEDTISVHVTDNPAYACAHIDITLNDDVSSTEPELEDGDVEEDVNDDLDGELAQSLNFMFWADDGDNVLESDEQVLTQGPADDILDGATWALADSEGSIFDPSDLEEGALVGATTYYVGKAFCFGDIAPAPLTQDDSGDSWSPASDNVGETGVTPEDGGFTCDGAAADNTTQTDRMEGDITFYAEQARNNSSFLCSEVDFGGVGDDDDDDDNIGALLSEYVQPEGENCDVNVPGDFATIQEAIDNAGTVNGDTICVGDEVYDEDVVINKEITLSGDGASATSVINGQTSGFGATVQIEADNVTVEGFVINGTDGPSAQDSAVYIPGIHSNITIRHNQLNAGLDGLAFLTTGGKSNVVVHNNELVGDSSPQVAYVNGDVSNADASSNVDFTNNTFEGTIDSGGVALGTESTGANVTQNIFAATLTSSYTIFESWKDDALVNENNFNGAGGTKVADSDPGAGPLNAQENWWGDADASDNFAGDVDFDPEAVAPFDEN